MKLNWKGSTLLNPERPVLVSCAYKNKTNILTIAWCGTINTRPPMVSISLRKERYSYELIKSGREFIINLPTKELVKAVDWCGIRSGKDYDKWQYCDLIPLPSSKLKTPLIKECPINLECIVKEIIPLGSHDMFIAEVVACDVDEELLDIKGKLDLDKAKLLLYSHGKYYELGNELAAFGFSVRKKKNIKKTLMLIP